MQGMKPASFLWDDKGTKYTAIEVAKMKKGSDKHLYRIRREAIQRGDDYISYKGETFWVRDPDAKKKMKRVKNEAERYVYHKGMTLLPGLCTHRLG